MNAGLVDISSASWKVHLLEGSVHGIGLPFPSSSHSLWQIVQLHLTNNWWQYQDSLKIEKNSFIRRHSPREEILAHCILRCANQCQYSLRCALCFWASWSTICVIAQEVLQRNSLELIAQDIQETIYCFYLGPKITQIPWVQVLKRQFGFFDLPDTLQVHYTKSTFYLAWRDWPTDKRTGPLCQKRTRNDWNPV